MGKYFKAAFANRWNLLALFAGAGAAVISGSADVVMPLVMAGEIVYVTMLATHSKFQRYVDAQDAKVKRERQSRSGDQAAREIVKALPKSTYQRFKKLRERCLELRQIANEMRQPGLESPGSSLESLHLEGLDRLLWVYLRLLFSHNTLGRFLEQTQEGAIQRDIDLIQQRLASLKEGDESPHARKIRRTLEDNLATCKDRLANYKKAKANYEFVELEIYRLENKIKTLSELAINRKEPDYISSQVDEVADSMLETERTMNELDFATGLGELDDEVPELLQTPIRTR